MKKIVIALCIAPSLVLAGGHGPKQLQGQAQGQAQLQGQLQLQGQHQGQGQRQKSVNKNLNLNLNVSKSKSKSFAKSKSFSDASSYSEGSNAASDSYATGGHSSADGTQTVTVGGDTYKPKRQTAGAPSITAFPSGPCTGASIGLSGGWLTGAFGFGGTSIDKECTQRASVQMLQALYERTGNPDYLELINKVILNMDSIQEVAVDEVERIAIVDKRVDEYERRRRQQDDYDWLRHNQK